MNSSSAAGATAHRQQVFISYARTDERLAREVRAWLLQHGYTPWMDVFNIPVGARWPDAIDHGLNQSAAVLGILTPRAIASENVKDEWDWAIANKRHLMLLLMERCSIPFHYVSRNYINFATSSRAKAFETLEKSLQSLPPIIATRQDARAGAGDQSVAEVRLPEFGTSFIGRDYELSRLDELLTSGCENRLITLSGPGGTGKTRLAIEAARQCAPGFPDGVLFVSLAAIRDPSLVLPAIAHELGIREDPDISLNRALTEFLAGKRLLLILDNFEQVVEAAPDVQDLVHGAPELHVLVTSRSLLNVRDEREVHVSPLGRPVAGLSTTAAELMQYASVRLFVHRARDIMPEFQLIDDNAIPVAEICSQLEGIPLAIELAAPRLRMLSLDQLATRLKNRLAVLTDGPRDMPARQRTLRDTVAWSYDLLHPGAQALFRYLGVFVGGWSIESAEAIWAEGNEAAEVDLLSGLTNLRENNLVQSARHAGGELRFSMLETIREYAIEQLQALRAEQAAFQSHALYFTDLASTAEPQLRGADRDRFLNEVEIEHDNIRAAIERMIASDSTLAGHLAASMWQFWQYRGHLSQGTRWLRRCLDTEGDLDPSLEAKLLDGAGALSTSIGDYEFAQRSLERSIELARLSKDLAREASARLHLATVLSDLGNQERAEAEAQRSLALYRKLEDPPGISEALNCLGTIWGHSGELGQAEQAFKESLDFRRRIRDEYGTIESLNNLGLVSSYLGDSDAAVGYFQECLTLSRACRDGFNVANTLANLGWLHLRENRFSQAGQMFEEALQTAHEMHQIRIIAECLDGLAEVMVGESRHDSAVQLQAAAQSTYESLGFVLSTEDQRRFDATRHHLHSLMPSHEFEENWIAGSTLDLHERVALASQNAAAIRSNAW